MDLFIVAVVGRQLATQSGVFDKIGFDYGWSISTGVPTRVSELPRWARRQGEVLLTSIVSS